MTHPNNEPKPATISTVTKHIKIYSDNPIHDCIDRIIDACACLDEGNDFCGMASAEMYEAADELLELCAISHKQKSDDFRRSLYERRTD